MTQKFKIILKINIWILLVIYLPAVSLAQGTLSGKIIDKATGASIVGATVYVSEFKTGAISNKDGFYTIRNLPQSKLKIQITCIGYKMLMEFIDLKVTTSKDFFLEESVSELSEIVVTGLSQAGEKNRTPTPITTMPLIDLLQSSSTNIIDAIASQPGISQLTTGAAISKPVIRGLGFNRVVVVNDGIRQEGQQWGDEHGIEIDEFSVNRVEILKGPASLKYGSDAMAGVINFLSAPTLPRGTIEGRFLTNYHTNDGLLGYGLSVAGNRNDIIWDVRWSNKFAHDYQNKIDGYVLNSGFNENNLSGIVGVNRAWGYSHVHFSIYNLNPEIVEGERDSITGNFVMPVALNDSASGFVQPSNSEYKSYSIQIPSQKVNHYKVVLNNNLAIADGSMKVIVGWQQNQRKEFGNVLTPDDYGLYFVLNTVNYDLNYNFPEKKKYNYSVGINGMFQTSQNKGTEYLVPEYSLFDVGVYGLISKSINKLDLSGGLRYDHRNETGQELILNSEGVEINEPQLGSIQKFNSFDSDFGSMSGSLGATYQISDIFYTKLNISSGFRAPNIAELGSNGEHEGSGKYEIGDPDLKAESSWQWDYTFGINSNHVTGELNLFTNSIDNFIFISKVNSSLGTDSLIDELPVFEFEQSNANLSGGEISIDIHPHPLDWLHFENTFSYVSGIRKNQPDSSKYLPNIPAPKFTSELMATTKKLNKILSNAYLKLGIDYYFEQNKIYSINNTETPTPAYSLLNFGAGTDLVLKSKTILSFYFSVNNLLDESYQSHLSRLKYSPENYATGKTGVFEMGRNFSFKIIVPLKFNVKQKR